MNVLVIAPHADDEVLGCGGTIARHVAEGDDVYVCVVTTGRPPVFDDTEAAAKGWPHIHYDEAVKSHGILGIKRSFWLGFPAAALEMVPRYELNGKMQETVDGLEPEVVYIPHFGDMQRDHALVSEAAMVAVRPKNRHTVRYVYSYETLSETEWNIPHARNTFLPNVYIDISGFLEKKIEAMSCYKSQLAEYPGARSLEAVEALARYRGSTGGWGAAEAFMLIREYRKQDRTYTESNHAHQTSSGASVKMDCFKGTEDIETENQ